MNIDDKIKTLRALRAETDAKAMQTGAIELGLLGEIEEELRTLRATVERQHDTALTEAQVAEIMQCSESSIAKLRLGGAIAPSFYVAERMARYWRSKLHEIFRDCRPGRKAGGRRQKAGNAGRVIPNSRFQIPESERPAA